MQFEFVVADWAAYADGLTTKSDWLAWALSEPRLPASAVAQMPALSEVAPMMRRRIDRLGRLACQVAYWCQSAEPDVPLVFASRYGDATRSLALLGDLVHSQPLSPTGFALSVHNAVAALYSIARGDLGNAVVVAGGRATAAAALIEARALLADGAPEVLVVCYDAPLPDGYAHFAPEVGVEFAWAWRVVPPDAGRQGQRVRLTLEEGSVVADPNLASWPEGLSVLRWFLRHTEVCHEPGACVQAMHSGVSSVWSSHA